MNKKRNYALALIFIITACLAANAGNLQVAKVDPPNWWSGVPQSPTLLISGAGLSGATASTDYLGLKIENAEASASGHYLFIHLQLSPNVKPGVAKIKINGPAGSAVIDFPILARTSIMPAGISKNDVIYLIMPDRFADGNTMNDNPPESPGQTDRNQQRKWHGGDLKGVTQHLPYLKQLGITAIWLTPWWKQAPSTSDYHGYHVVDFYAVDPHLGSLAELQEMTAAAHQQGIKVIIDYVVNHVGPLHPWAQDPPTPTWLHGTPQKHEHFDYDFAQLVDPHASPQQYRPILEGWFADSLPDLNPDDPKLEAYLRDNAIWWTEMGSLDGFRLDTFPYSSRTFWRKWHQDMRDVYPNLWTLGEISNGDPWITSFFAGGHAENGIDTGVSTVFDFPLANAVRDVTLHDGDVRRIVSILQHDNLYPHPSGLVTFIGNHDMRRYMGEPGATPAKLKAAISLLLTLRGIPELYAGDEIAMPGADDPDNRRDFPGGFPGDKHDAFTSNGRAADEEAVFSYVQTLLRLRREHPALTQGKLSHISVAKDHYAFVRESGNDRVLVIFNASNQKERLSLDLIATPLENTHSLVPLFDAGQAEVEGGHAHLVMDPMSVSIYLVH